MAVTRVDVDQFMSLALLHPVVDVRSPAEYKHAHLPKAYSLPLFDNEERKIVGTAYKQESRQQAIKIGLQFFGSKMVQMVEEVEQLAAAYSDAATPELDRTGAVKPKTILTYCWRGGMRSAGVAWLLDLYGFKVYTLHGGYKSFRNWVLKKFEQNYALHILGGCTGSNKTGILCELKNRGFHVIDLEALASHKGSAFGNIGMSPQPSQEMFENLLAIELWKSHSLYKKECVTGDTAAVNGAPGNIIIEPPKYSAIWLEDESQRIGDLNIPPPLWKQMMMMPLCFLEVPFEKRLDHIIDVYGKGDKEKLHQAILRIQKRLGGLETKTAINYLLEDNLKECFRILLVYYDKFYHKALARRRLVNTFVQQLNTDTIDAQQNASLILQKYG